MPSEPMVLRSINLPPELDDQLRAVAFALRRPKSDLIRMFVADGLSLLRDRLRSASENDVQNLSAYISKRIEGIGKAFSKDEGLHFQEDLARMQRFIDRQERAQVGEHSPQQGRKDEDQGNWFSSR
jgi:predicted DNA-binding protein